MYYGEEIGMTNNDPQRKEDVQDPIGKTGWPKEKGRDGERTPMQWNDSANAGFSTAKPWLPVPASYATHNVTSELKDPDSILSFYQKLLALRHQNHALLDGEYVALNQEDPNVLSFLRKYKDEAVLVVLNMSAAAQNVSFDLGPQGYASAKGNALVTTDKALNGEHTLQQVSMQPFGVYIAAVSK
jgi:alpha-glucosidase